MKLVELNPTWIAPTDPPEKGIRHVVSFVGPEPQGVQFDCPTCQGADAHRITIWFAGRDVPATAPFGDHQWVATGTSFETLTLSPSIDIRWLDENGNVADQDWHGHVTAGSIT